MNTRYLRSLCLVSDLGTISGAARQLGFATASVAEHIRALEGELQAKLLVRRGQGVALTPAGLAVLGRARTIVDDCETLKHVAQLGRPSGRLRVGSISTGLVSLLPKGLRHLTEQFPEISLTVVPGTSSGLFQMLERNEIDCALMVKPPFSLAKELTWQNVRNEPLVLVTPIDHVQGDLRTMCLTAPHIRMDRKAWSGQIIERYLKDNAIEANELFELDAPEIIVTLVAQGMGISLLPDWGISSAGERGIRVTVIDDGTYSRRVGILSRRGPASVLVDSFFESVKAQFEER